MKFAFAEFYTSESTFKAVCYFPSAFDSSPGEPRSFLSKASIAQDSSKIKSSETAWTEADEVVRMYICRFCENKIPPDPYYVIQQDLKYKLSMLSP